MKNDAKKRTALQRAETSRIGYGTRTFWRRTIGCAILVMAALIAACPSVETSSAKLRKKGESTDFRANFHCVLRDEDAMVIDSSYFVSDVRNRPLRCLQKRPACDVTRSDLQILERNAPPPFVLSNLIPHNKYGALILCRRLFPRTSRG